MIINNAGICFGKTLLSLSTEEIDRSVVKSRSGSQLLRFCRTIKTNLLAHFYVTKAFLPSLIRANSGHIVSSCNGTWARTLLTLTRR